MLYFAYDASANADWVSRYAIRFASHTAEQRLRLLYVDDGSHSPSKLDDRIGHLQRESEAASVELQVELHRCRSKNVAARILELVPPGQDTLLVCGTRRWQRNFSLLAETVAEKLLLADRFHVLAIHVAEPGMLGVPRNILLPTVETFGAPFLKLLAPDLDRLNVLLVKKIGHLSFHRLSHDRAEALLAEAHRKVEQRTSDLKTDPLLAKAYIDGKAVLSDDLPKEIIIHANQLAARLILMPATKRSLPHRFLYGNPIEQVLRNAPCDVAIHRGPT